MERPPAPTPDLPDLRRRLRGFLEDVVLPAEADALRRDDVDDKVLTTLRAEARARGLWTPHLPRAWGGLGLGAVGMAVVHEELGASPLGPLAVNASAPDEGNMHLLLAAGTDAQKERFLRPLADGGVRSCFAMTEPDAGADPTRLRTTARRDDDHWVLDGHKWFITGARGAAFAVVMAVTDPDVKAQEGASLFLVPTDTSGWTVVRDIPTMGTHAPGGHGEAKLEGVRVPLDHLLGDAGRGFALAQERLGMGRITHAMRWIGMAQRALDLAARRALTREAFGEVLADKQAVQWMLAESAMDLATSRLLVHDAAAKFDAGLPHRVEVSMLKVHVARALHRVVDRAIQVHGALGYSTDLPLERFYRDARAARIYDGPDEVHLMVVARAVLKEAHRTGSTRATAGGSP